MEFHAEEEVRLRPRRAWAEVTNFSGFEKLIRDRGGAVTRSETPDPPGLGTTWEGRFTYSGKPRDVTAEVTRFEPPHHLHIALTSAGLSGQTRVELTDLGQRRTRISVHLTLEARTLKARIFLQPLKLAQSTLEARFAKAVARLTRAMEKRRKGK